MSGEEHPDTPRAMADLASTSSASGQGRWREVQELETKVLETRTLASIHRAKGHIPKAIEVLTLAHRYAENVRSVEGVEHSHLVRWTKRPQIWELEDTKKRTIQYYCRGFRNEAEVLNAIASDMSKTVHGETHPDTITCIGNLACTYHKQGRISAVVEWMTRALHDAEITPTKESFDLGEGVNALENFRKFL
ncbi:hypothetical protein BDV97DRAFT_396103 [Delphinella strobiligena]|nr:hypothetical protein BDV97DRAFT_396103 [Delphinella strobiligena]